MEMKFKIFRFDPSQDDQPRVAQYNVEADPKERILDCLSRIRWERDDSLAFRSSCAHGICGSDAMVINGVCGLACQKLVNDYSEGSVALAPLPSFRVIKDLIVDLSPFLEKVSLVEPYLQSLGVAPEGERLQDPKDSEVLSEVIRCILCASCMGACPVVQGNGQFLGPAPLVWAFRFIFDSRDQAKRKRLQAADDPHGAWGCENHFACTRVCPKEIKITKSINRIKREIEREFDK